MLLEAEINPPGGRQQRTGSNSSAYPSMPSALPRTISMSQYSAICPIKISRTSACRLGHRRKMLAAISELYRRGPATPEPAARMEPKTQDTAERRQLTVMSTDVVGSRALDEAQSRRSKAIMTARCYRLGSGLARLLRPHRFAAEDVSSLCAEFGRREPKRQSGPVEG